MLYLFWSLLKIHRFFSITGNCKQKIWLKQPKAASALDFSYFQHVSKLVTHDKQEPQTHWFQRVCGSFCFNRTLKSLCSFCCDTNRHQCVSVLHCSGFRIFDVAKVWFSDTLSCSWHQRLTPTVSLTPNDTIFVGKPYRKKSCSFEVVFQFWRGWLLLWLQRVGVKISLPELVPRLRWCQRLNREFAA